MDYKSLIKSIKNFEEYKVIKSKILSNEGPVFELKEKIKNCDAKDKAEYGKKLSSLKNEIDELLENKLIEINNNSLNEKINKDKNNIYALSDEYVNFHPLFLVSQRIREWFLQNGYFEEKVIELESDYYNFEKLNIPKNHPARDMQDTLYLNENILLRTHNTGVTARMLEKYQNCEFSYFTIGKVYRNDEDDQTHSHQFTQVDFLSVGQHSIQSLLWTLKSLLSYVFEEDIKIRTRPSFFPFTEPSIEVDMFYKGSWVEILGSGMINEDVLKMSGYNEPDKFRGFAGGIGVERVAMIKYGIKDIRDFFRNDLRMIKQFR
ncbi:MAG: phenylalanine--tRNA ligase subunit alpha [Mycoplasma sp.]|nr:phenylalanine--tRNA ligase subunit alpha [Mycoplasma sp.]